MLLNIIEGISEVFESIDLSNSDTNSNKHHLKSRFGNASELMSRFNKGFSLTGHKFISSLKSFEHLLYFGPSGSGKTTVSIIPSAINIARYGKSSMILNNPSGELQKLEGYLISKGYTVISFNPNDKRNSIYFNPLARIKNKTDIQKVATILVLKGSKKSPDFWQIKSIELVSLIIEFLLNHSAKVYQNLGNVYRLLQHLAGDEDTVSKLFASESSEKEWQAYKAVINNSDNTKASIISSAISSLSFIGNNPELCDITSVDSFDFQRLRTEKVCLFLNIRTMDMEFFSPIIGLFFEQLFSELMNDIPTKEDNNLYIMIDELSSIPLPSLPTVIANARKYFGILGVLQSEAQLQNNYGEHSAKAILNNATKVYMSGLDAEAERLSKALGQYQYFEDKDQKVLRTRSLMTANEIRFMPQNRVIIMPNGGMRPIYSEVVPFYKSLRFHNCMDMEIPDSEEYQDNIQYSIQYLPLDKYKNHEQ